MKLLYKIKYSVLLAMILFTSACEKGNRDQASPSLVDISTPIIITPKEVVKPDDTVENTLNEEFMELINDHRISIGLHPLVDDEDLSKISLKHSSDMESGTIPLGHTGFSSRCSEAKAFIGGGNLCGENVAMGQKTPLAVFNAWMNSPGHRANIEQGRYTHSGFGYKKSASGTYYWTHLFLEEK